MKPSDAIRTDLNAGDRFHIHFVAAGRDFANAIEKRNAARGKANGYDPMADIIGCAAEYATAKSFNLCWSSMFDRHAVDVGGLIEVRGSRLRPHSLVVHSDDKDEYPFMCVDCSPLFTVAPHVWLLGWMHARQAKKFDKKQLRPDRPPSHLVPVDKLHPCHELKPELLDRFK